MAVTTLKRGGQVRKNSDGSVSYYYDFYIHGKRHRGVLEARTKAQADKEERRVWDEIYEGKHGRPKGEKTMREFIENDFLPWAKTAKRSWKNDRSRVKPIIAFFGNKRLCEVAPFHVEAFKIKRRESEIRSKDGSLSRQRSKASVNRELQLLSRIFSLAIKNRQATSNPCEKSMHENGLLLKGDNRRSRILSDEEEERLMEALTGDRVYLHPILLVALGTAMRRGNILGLRWQDVDFSRSCIYVSKTKSDLNYDVPMNKTVEAELLELRRQSKSDFVFLNPQTSKPWADVKRAFEAACCESEIDRLWFHDLRRTAATRMADNGVPLSVIQGILGHSDIKTTMRYIHTVSDDKRRAVSTLEKGSKKNGLVKMWSNKKRAAG